MTEPKTLPPNQALTALWAARLGLERSETPQLEALEAGVLYAFDAAFPAPPAVYRANGGIAANVYVSGNYGQSAAHVGALRSGGLGAWPNYEVGLWELVSNRAAGQAAGRRGIADAIRCGFPANGTIWFPFSVDVSVNPTQYNQVAEAFRGIQDVNAGRFLISFYGQGGLASYLRQNRIINQKCWLSASSSFPGYNQNSPDICLWQQVGNFIPGYSTDRNVITDVASLPAYWPSGSPYGGNNMSQADIDAINAHIDKAIGLVMYGDSLSAAQGKTPQGHPWNMYQNSGKLDKIAGQTDTLEGSMVTLRAAVAGLPTADQIAQKVFDKLPPASTGGLTKADIAAAMREVLSEGVNAAPPKP